MLVCCLYAAHSPLPLRHQQGVCHERGACCCARVSPAAGASTRLAQRHQFTCALVLVGTAASECYIVLGGLVPCFKAQGCWSLFVGSLYPYDPVMLVVARPEAHPIACHPVRCPITSVGCSCGPALWHVCGGVLLHYRDGSMCS